MARALLAESWASSKLPPLNSRCARRNHSSAFSGRVLLGVVGPQPAESAAKTRAAVTERKMAVCT